jgi:hypothetical protein
MTYVYGSTPESRVQDETPSRVYSWYLTDITDVFGNNVHYEYIKDDNFVYPHKITYTNYSSNQGIYEIRFNFEGGQSNHNYGKAIDVTVMENGQAYVYPVNSTIANIAKEQGFSWGGDWNKVKDLPHFEMFFDKK